MEHSGANYLYQYRNMVSEIRKLNERLLGLKAKAKRTTQFQSEYVSGTKQTRSLEKIVESIEITTQTIHELERRCDFLRIEMTLNITTFVHDGEAGNMKITPIEASYEYYLDDDLPCYEDIGKRHDVTGKAVFGAVKKSRDQISKAIQAHPDRFTFYEQGVYVCRID